MGEEKNYIAWHDNFQPTPPLPQVQKAKERLESFLKGYLSANIEIDYRAVFLPDRYAYIVFLVQWNGSFYDNFYGELTPVVVVGDIETDAAFYTDQFIISLDMVLVRHYHAPVADAWFSINLPPPMPL